jgi:hypothetical protein
MSTDATNERVASCSSLAQMGVEIVVTPPNDVVGTSGTSKHQLVAVQLRLSISGLRVSWRKCGERAFGEAQLLCSPVRTRSNM